MDTQIGEIARQECSMEKPAKTVKRERPRRETMQLQIDRDILKKAAKYFARESP